MAAEPGAGAELATAEEGHDSFLLPCLLAGPSSNGNLATFEREESNSLSYGN